MLVQQLIFEREEIRNIVLENLLTEQLHIVSNRIAKDILNDKLMWKLIYGNVK